jgi:hypothetical protein
LCELFFVLLGVLLVKCCCVSFFVCLLGVLCFVGFLSFVGFRVWCVCVCVCACVCVFVLGEGGGWVGRELFFSDHGRWTFAAAASVDRPAADRQR